MLPAPEQADEDGWEGVPLELEGEPPEEPGEETVERPVSELLPPPPRPVGVRLLSYWMLLSGLTAAALAVGAVAAALACGTRPVAWQGPLLALNGAVVALIVRSFLRAGAPARAVCHRTFGAAGLAVGAAVILGTLLGSAVDFIYGTPFRDVLSRLFVFGLAGLGGSMVFFECLRGRGWACRAAVVSTVIFAALLGLQPYARYALLGGRPGLPLAFLEHYWPGGTAAFSCVLGFAVILHGSRREQGRSRLGLALTGAWLAVLLAVVAFLTWQMADHYGPAGATARLSVMAGFWALAALLPPVVVGAAVAWRERGALRADLYGATRFATVMVALGGLACLALWLPTHVRTGGLELFLVPLGVVAGLTGAWLVEKRGDWVSRWALVLALGLALAVLSGLSHLLDFAGAGLWRLGTAFLWCPVSVGLIFAAAGLAVRRSRGRARSPELTVNTDVRLVCSAGWMLSALVLAALFALAAGDPAVHAATARSLAAGRDFAHDLLRLLGGSLRISALASEAADGASAAAPPAVLAGAVAALVLVVHLAAARRIRWALWAAVALWVVPVAAGAVLALLYASRLFLPLPEPRPRTALAGAMSSRFSARLLVFVVLVVLVSRFAEALASVLRAAARRPAKLQRPAGRWQPAVADADPGSSHLGFLVGLGVVLAGTGLALALLLELRPEVEAALFELANLARRCGQTAVVPMARAGQLSSEWLGYAAAAGLTLFLLVSICEEARRGRLEAYPLLGSFWVLIIVPLLAGWALEVRATLSPPAPGRVAALAVTGILLAALVAATAVVWAHWMRAVRRRRAETLGGAMERRPQSWAAHTLGSLGLALCLVAGAVAARAALAETMARRLAGVGAAAAELVDRVAADVDALHRALQKHGDLGTVAVTMIAASLALLLLNVLARYRIASARRLLYALWFALALCAAGGAGYVLHEHPLGTWTPAQVVTALLTALVLGRTVAALASPGSWLIEPTDPGEPDAAPAR
jgi:hypothetical protein